MSLTLSYGMNSITIAQPYFGYSSIINLALQYSRVNNGYKIRDNGTAYDYRVCEIPTWLLNAPDQLELSMFLNDITQGRGNDITLSLGESPSGFFPFGPDKGDVGDFVCSVLDYKRGNAQLSPYLQHSNTLSLVYVSGPAYSPASAEIEGTLSIGTVTTLRPFQTFPAADFEQSIIREVSRGGVVSSVDLGTSGDLYESAIDLELRPGNAAALVTYLQATRGGDISVSTPANSWMFGVDQYAAGIYTCKLLSNSIKIVHENYNLFKTNLKFWMKSNDTPGPDFSWETGSI